MQKNYNLIEIAEPRSFYSIDIRADMAGTVKIFKNASPEKCIIEKR